MGGRESCEGRTGALSLSVVQSQQHLGFLGIPGPLLRIAAARAGAAPGSQPPLRSAEVAWLPPAVATLVQAKSHPHARTTLGASRGPRSR
jgi:hypothetical protein